MDTYFGFTHQKNPNRNLEGSGNLGDKFSGLSSREIKLRRMYYGLFCSSKLVCMLPLDVLETNKLDYFKGALGRFMKDNAFNGYVSKWLRNTSCIK